MIKLNPSIKHHLLIGVFICIWGFIFAFFIRPFDDGTLNFKAWLLISIGFNVIAFIAYALTSLAQKFVYQKIEKWNITLEVISIIFYQILYTIELSSITKALSFYQEDILFGHSVLI
ncbi:hypothetical protein [Aquimarina aquimarini]|uniref:hypothetical protein n=1 Tax=Aquimarina aquimarini TaxID=1191734 RepID=UPI001F45E28D|nr:hypothetical protein [Aquimarina aquimarini]